MRRYCAAAARRSSSPPPPPPPPLPRGTENVTPTVRGEPLAFRFGMKSSRVHAMAYAFYGVGFYGPRHSASMACAAASILLRRPPDLGAWRHGACMAYATAALHGMHECKRFFTIIICAHTWYQARWCCHWREMRHQLACLHREGLQCANIRNWGIFFAQQSSPGDLRRKNGQKIDYRNYEEYPGRPKH